MLRRRAHQPLLRGGAAVRVSRRFPDLYRCACHLSAQIDSVDTAAATLRLNALSTRVSLASRSKAPAPEEPESSFRTFPCGRKRVLTCSCSAQQHAQNCHPISRGTAAGRTRASFTRRCSTRAKLYVTQPTPAADHAQHVQLSRQGHYKALDATVDSTVCPKQHRRTTRDHENTLALALVQFLAARR